MSVATLDRLLAGTHPDPDGGAPLKIDTKSVVIARSLAGQEGDVVAALGLGRRIAIVSDDTTHAILGHRKIEIAPHPRSLTMWNPVALVLGVETPARPSLMQAMVEGFYRFSVFTAVWNDANFHCLSQKTAQVI